MASFRNLSLLTLWLLVLFLVAGCAATSKSMLEEAETLVVSVNGESGPAAGRFTREQLIGGLLVI